MYLYYAQTTSDIQNNWNEYKCNPLYMAFADDVSTNFSYCVQNMQSNYMGYILQPLTFLTSSMGETMGEFATGLNSARGMIANIRSLTTDLFANTFGVFFNLVVEFQKIIIGIKDTMSKTIGIVVTFLYVLDGSMKTMGSMWKGPSGQMVRSMGKCFHPDTILSLENGSCKCMKDLELGDILKGGSIVEAIMKINNTEEIPFYEINSGDNDIPILVTGSHHIYDTLLNKFIPVRNYEFAKKTDWISPQLSCLITHNHQICIGDYVFWDWEDWLLLYTF
jgi:hypothetical protein